MTMINPGKFEIKVAVVGHVSVGKTTVLNALFREKYSEVSMRRTTAGVNYFTLSQRVKHKVGAVVEEESGSSGSEEPMEWSVTDREMRTADSTLKEIAEDNAVFRESDEIHEKFFDIELSEVFCNMRNDTRLVLVDIPGTNEANTGAKYKEYVEQKWNTFDCVVLVMDGRTGINTEEQVELL